MPAGGSSGGPVATAAKPPSRRPKTTRLGRAYRNPRTSRCEALDRGLERVQVFAMVPRMNGLLMVQHLRILRERYGAAAVDAALDDLGTDRRERLVAATPLSWVDLPDFEAFHGVLAERLDRAVPALHEQTARESTRRNFRTVWRLLLRLTTDGALLSRAPAMWSRTWSRGTVVGRRTGPGRGEVELRGWPEPPDFVARAFRIGVEEILTLAGRRGVATRVARTDDGLRLTVRWGAVGPRGADGQDSLP